MNLSKRKPIPPDKSFFQGDTDFHYKHYRPSKEGHSLEFRGGRVNFTTMFHVRTLTSATGDRDSLTISPIMSKFIIKHLMEDTGDK